MLTPADVASVYERCLGRSPETAERIARCVELYGDVAALTSAVRNSDEYRARGRERLEGLLAGTDGYQAVYTLPTLSAEHARDSEDRCQAVATFVEQSLRAGTLAHLSILDVGCAQGFTSLFFADRGSHVIGIDNNQANVRFCQALAEVSGIDAGFRTTEFADQSVELAVEYGVNAVFLFSVLHHVIFSRGLAWTRRAIARLLDTGAVLFCELAQQEEAVPFAWRAALPAEATTVFPNEARIERIGGFAALNGTVRRPMFAVYNRTVTFHPLQDSRQAKRLVSFGQRPRTADVPDLRLSAVTNLAVRIKQYHVGAEVFVKRIRITQQNRLELMRLANSELLISALLSDTGVCPKLIGAGAQDGSMTLVFERVDAPNLPTYAASATLGERRAAAVQVAEGMAKLWTYGLSWNDCREHNILVRPGGSPVFLDFEFAAFYPLEDDAKRCRWMLWHLCHSADFGAVMQTSSHLPTEELPVIEERQAAPEWTAVVEALGAGAD